MHRSTTGHHPRVLFVLKYRDQPYGSDWGDGRGGQPLSSGLFNSARFMAEMLAEAGIATHLVHVADGNGIHREIVKFRATHVVIEAFWCPPYKLDDLHRACPDVQFIVRNHSETPFLASEGMAFEWSFEYLKRPNVALAPNSLRMWNDTRFLVRQAHPDWSDAELERRVPYLPNAYPVDRARHPRKRDDGVLDVGCFGAVRPLKNVVTQATGALVAAKAMGRRLNFHINGGRVEMGGSPILKNLVALFAEQPDARLVSHGWLAHDGFRRLVARMDLVSQVTFSETFNIVCADAVSQGVPIVTSAEVAWSDPASQADPTDARSIAQVMARALAHSHGHGEDPNLTGLQRASALARDLWLARLA
jgi:glycosyltransferase involved in cell wall biosynthesis